MTEESTTPETSVTELGNGENETEGGDNSAQEIQENIDVIESTIENLHKKNQTSEELLDGASNKHDPLLVAELDAITDKLEEIKVLPDSAIKSDDAKALRERVGAFSKKVKQIVKERNGNGSSVADSSAVEPGVPTTQTVDATNVNETAVDNLQDKIILLRTGIDSLSANEIFQKTIDGELTDEQKEKIAALKQKITNLKVALTKFGKNPGKRKDGELDKLNTRLDELSSDANELKREFKTKITQEPDTAEDSPPSSDIPEKSPGQVEQEPLDIPLKQQVDSLYDEVSRLAKERGIIPNLRRAPNLYYSQRYQEALEELQKAKDELLQNETSQNVITKTQEVGGQEPGKTLEGFTQSIRNIANQIQQAEGNDTLTQQLQGELGEVVQSLRAQYPDMDASEIKPILLEAFEEAERRASAESTPDKNQEFQVQLGVLESRWDKIRELDPRQKDFSQLEVVKSARSFIARGEYKKAQGELAKLIEHINRFEQYLEEEAQKRLQNAEKESKVEEGRKFWRLLNDIVNLALVFKDRLSNENVRLIRNPRPNERSQTRGSKGELQITVSQVIEINDDALRLLSVINWDQEIQDAQSTANEAEKNNDSETVKFNQEKLRRIEAGREAIKQMATAFTNLNRPIEAWQVETRKDTDMNDLEIGGVKVADLKGIILGQDFRSGAYDKDDLDKLDPANDIMVKKITKVTKFMGVDQKGSRRSWYELSGHTDSASTVNIGTLKKKK